MSTGDLEKTWSDLPISRSGELSGKRIPGLPLNVPVYVVIDSSRQRQLLVPITEEAPALRSSATRGLVVSTDRLQIADSPVRRYIRLACVDVLHYPTFTALCENIVSAVLAAPKDPKGAVVRCLERWRSFWAVDQSGLTREQALGLFGELWFLYRWLGPLSASSLSGWTGPLGARHDFQWPRTSVEVKATTSAPGAAPVHVISSLDQLDEPEVGRLYLFSLHLVDDALAGNSLPLLVEQINDALGRDAETFSMFSERLARAGYNPVDAARYIRPLRVLAEELYSVDEPFPKLTRQSFHSGVPTGVGDVEYSLSMAACVRWRIAVNPGDSGAALFREQTAG
jgi:hypothetical protein